MLASRQPTRNPPLLSHAAREGSDSGGWKGLHWGGKTKSRSVIGVAHRAMHSPPAAPGASQLKQLMVYGCYCCLWLLWLLWLLLLVPARAATLGSWKSAETSAGSAFASKSRSLPLNSCATEATAEVGLSSVLGISCSLELPVGKVVRHEHRMPEFFDRAKDMVKGCSRRFHCHDSFEPGLLWSWYQIICRRSA